MAGAVRTATAPPTLDVRADFPILQREINGHVSSIWTPPPPRRSRRRCSRRSTTTTAATTRTSTAASTRSRRRPTRCSRERAANRRLHRRTGALDDLHPQRDRGDQPGRILLGAHDASARRHGADHRDGAPLEHRPWQLATQATGAELRYLEIDDAGTLSLDQLERELERGHVRLVALTHVSNVLGTINPVAEMVARAHAAGALVLIDGAQAVPQMPVDFAAIGADFYAWTGHKALGPTGVGVLHADAALLDSMPPSWRAAT